MAITVERTARAGARASQVGGKFFGPQLGHFAACCDGFLGIANAVAGQFCGKQGPDLPTRWKLDCCEAVFTSPAVLRTIGFARIGGELGELVRVVARFVLGVSRGMTLTSKLLADRTTARIAPEIGLVDVRHGRNDRYERAEGDDYFELACPVSGPATIFTMSALRKPSGG